MSNLRPVRFHAVGLYRVKIRLQTFQTVFLNAQWIKLNLFMS